MDSRIEAGYLMIAIEEEIDRNRKFIEMAFKKWHLEVDVLSDDQIIFAAAWIWWLDSIAYKMRSNGIMGNHPVTVSTLVDIGKMASAMAPFDPYPCSTSAAKNLIDAAKYKIMERYFNGEARSGYSPERLLDDAASIKEEHREKKAS